MNVMPSVFLLLLLLLIAISHHNNIVSFSGNNDYVQITTTLILSTEALTGCILFDIVDDSFIEQIEIFTIRARFGTVTVDARIAIFSEDGNIGVIRHASINFKL